MDNKRLYSLITKGTVGIIIAVVSGIVIFACIVIFLMKKIVYAFTESAGIPDDSISNAMNLGLGTAAIGGIVLFVLLIPMFIGAFFLIKYCLSIFKRFLVENPAIHENGIAAQAKVLKIIRKGQFNYKSNWKMLLEVMIPGKPRYQITESFIVEGIQPYVKPGVLLPIKVDKNNPQRAILDVDQIAPSSASPFQTAPKKNGAGSTAGEEEPYEAVGNVEPGEIHNGTKAEVKIISFTPSKEKRNGQQVFHMVGAVSTDQFATSYTIKRETALPLYAAALMEEGKTYPCEIDPNDKNRVVIKTAPQTFLKNA